MQHWLKDDQNKTTKDDNRNQGVVKIKSGEIKSGARYPLFAQELRRSLDYLQKHPNAVLTEVQRDRICIQLGIAAQYIVENGGSEEAYNAVEKLRKLIEGKAGFARPKGSESAEEINFRILVEADNRLNFTFDRGQKGFSQKKDIGLIDAARRGRDR